MTQPALVLTHLLGMSASWLLLLKGVMACWLVCKKGTVSSGLTGHHMALSWALDVVPFLHLRLGWDPLVGPPVPVSTSPRNFFC